MSADSGCYFCGGGQGVLETHHIVPRRLGGTDADDNLVDLCPTCHQRLERLYDDEFYRKLGVDVGKRQSGDELGVCKYSDCTAGAEWVVGGVEDIEYCDTHKTCSFDDCDTRSVKTIPANGSAAPFCEHHRTCSAEGCASTDTVLHRADIGTKVIHRAYCHSHGPQATILGEQFEVSW